MEQQATKMFNITHKNKQNYVLHYPQRTNKNTSYRLQITTEQNHGMVAASSNIFSTLHYSTPRNSRNIVRYYSQYALF